MDEMNPKPRDKTVGIQETYETQQTQEIEHPTKEKTPNVDSRRKTPSNP